MGIAVIPLRLWPRHATGSRVKRRGQRVQQEKSTTHEFEPGVSVSRLFQARPTSQATHTATLLIRISLPVCFFCTKVLAGRSAAKGTATYRMSRAKGSSGKPLLDHTRRPAIGPSPIRVQEASARSWKVKSTLIREARVKHVSRPRMSHDDIQLCETIQIWSLEEAGSIEAAILPSFHAARR